MNTDKSELQQTDHLAHGAAMVSDRYRILMDMPVPEWDRPGAPAYVARDARSPDRGLIAFACSRDILPRIDVMVQVKSMRGAALMSPLDWGPVSDLRGRKDCLAVIFERPENSPLIGSIKDRFEPFSANYLRSQLLEPSIETLLLLARRSITHRAIRPTNLFADSFSDGAVHLGECVTTPPGWAQPSCLETIEMAMTPANARGRGGMEHDIYALGATMLFLALGHCPVAELSESALIAMKVESGSLQALLNGERSPLGLREPLRGMLADDPEERWGPDDIQEWLSGNVRRPLQAGRQDKTDRPFKFKGQDFRQPRVLADAFGRRWNDAIKAAGSAVFQKWVGMAVAELRENFGGNAADADTGPVDRLVEPSELTALCMLLDPLGPLRHRGLIANADGLGNALAEAVTSNSNQWIEIATDVIRLGLCEAWLGRPIIDGRSDFTMIRKTFQKLQRDLALSGPGGGIERCVYELCPFSPCFSDAVGNAYVHGLRGLLPALEAAVVKSGRLPDITDRHLVAFIAARSKENLSNALVAINDNEPGSIEARIAVLAMLAAVQGAHGPERLVTLTEALADDLEPALGRYGSRSLRADLRRRLEVVAARGSLGELYDHFNNPGLLKKDELARQRAIQEFTDATAMINELESGAYEDSARQAGWNTAATVANMIAMVGLVTAAVW